MSDDWIKNVPFGGLSTSGSPLLLRSSPSGLPPKAKGVH